MTHAKALAERTADAYSWDNYGESSWFASCFMLLRRGYSETEAEAILRSKYTRWAADSASSRDGWRYGKTSSRDLARYIDGQIAYMGSDRWAAEVADLTANTFEERTK